MKLFTASFPHGVPATCCCFNNSHTWSGHYSAPAKPVFLCSTAPRAVGLPCEPLRLMVKSPPKMASLAAKYSCSLIPRGFPGRLYKMSLFLFPLSPFSGHLSVSRHASRRTLLPNPASTVASTAFRTPFSFIHIISVRLNDATSSSSCEPQQAPVLDRSYLV